MIAALPRPVRTMRALVLGAGGSARASAWGLRNAGAEVEIWNRTPAKAEALAAELGVGVTESPAEFDLLVNATTLGLGQASERPPQPADIAAFPLDAESIGARHVVVDLVYGGYETALVATARERGARVVDGLEVLVCQGAASLRIWTGAEPSLDDPRDAPPATGRLSRRRARHAPGPGRHPYGVSVPTSRLTFALTASLLHRELRFLDRGGLSPWCPGGVTRAAASPLRASGKTITESSPAAISAAPFAAVIRPRSTPIGSRRR